MSGMRPLAKIHDEINRTQDTIRTLRASVTEFTPYHEQRRIREQFRELEQQLDTLWDEKRTVRAALEWGHMNPNNRPRLQPVSLQRRAAPDRRTDPYRFARTSA